MRALIVAGLAATALLAAGCSSSSAHPPASCADLPQPTISLAIRPQTVPSRAQALCLARAYAVVIGTRAWGDLPKAMEAVSGRRLSSIWQQRSLMYACDTCSDAVFRASWLRSHHPGWILHTESGAEVHPLGRPDQVLVNVGNADFDVAWAQRVAKQLTPEGWTGVDAVDLANNPQFTGQPVNPVTGRPLTEGQRRLAVAHALELIRGTFGARSTPIELVGQMPPVSVVANRLINSTFAIDGGSGFARVSGAAWEQTFDYYDAAWVKLTNSYVFDTPGRLSRSRQVYGLASFLLIATPYSAYGAPGDPSNPLYRRTLGAPCACDPPVQTGDVWTRTYPNGGVAVNPGPTAATATLAGGRRLSLPPVSAAIVDGKRVIRS